jgi:predicted lysophospholipase L1 biosynthesis ABC-type transport system permease subunit
VDIILTALAELADPFRMLILISGVLIGLVIGVVPGVNGIMGLAMLIPLTYHLDPYAAFALLLGMASVTNTSCGASPAPSARWRPSWTDIPWQRRARPLAPLARPMPHP